MLSDAFRSLRLKTIYKATDVRTYMSVTYVRTYIRIYVFNARVTGDGPSIGLIVGGALFGGLRSWCCPHLTGTKGYIITYLDSA